MKLTMKQIKKIYTDNRKGCYIVSLCDKSTQIKAAIYEANDKVDLGYVFKQWLDVLKESWGFSIKLLVWTIVVPPTLIFGWIHTFVKVSIAINKNKKIITDPSEWTPTIMGAVVNTLKTYRKIKYGKFN